MRKSYLMCLLLLAPLMCVPGNAHATPTGWAPADFAAMYHLQKTGSSATTVVVVSAFKQTSLDSRLATYRSQFGLPACTVANGCLKILNQTGGTTQPTTAASNSWQINGDTQAQLASAGCPDCKITVILADSDTDANLATALKLAPTKGEFVNAGFGIAETSTEVSGIESAFSGGTVGLFAPSGDGSGAIQYPAASPKAFGVSRTSVSLASGVYSHTLNGGRSVYSAVFARQSYEPSAFTGHDSAVIAVVGTNVAINTVGGWTTANSTLASSALFAGMVASLEGEIVLPSDAAVDPHLDLTTGTDDVSNSPTSGYDKASGMGAVDFTTL